MEEEETDRRKITKNKRNSGKGLSLCEEEGAPPEGGLLLVA